MSQSKLETLLASQIRLARLPIPKTEYSFAASVGRKFRADFAWPNRWLLVEVEGGLYSRGRHVQPAGYQKDCQKYNLATLLGWQILRFTAKMIRSGEALNTIEKALYCKKGALHDK